MSEARDDIVETTCRLLEQQGYHATGINQIVEESGAPKGSIYYYFPDGKDQICEEAIRQMGETIRGRIEGLVEEHGSADGAVRALITTIAEQLEASEYRAGGPLTTVALESAPDNARLTDACQDAYASWQQPFAEQMIRDGVDESTATGLASLVISSIEGALVLSRTFRDRAPLERAARHLEHAIQEA